MSASSTSSVHQAQVVEIVVADLWQLNRVNWVKVEIPSRRKQRNMRPEVADCQKERSILTAADHSAAPLGDFPVAHLAVGNVHRTPIERLSGRSAAHGRSASR